MASNGRCVNSWSGSTSTSGSPANGSKSVKLEIPGTSATPMTTRSVLVGVRCRPPFHPKASSSGRSTSRQCGSTPAQDSPVSADTRVIPSLSRLTSPRNLFIANAFRCRRSASSSSAQVPTSDAKTPPRSMPCGIWGSTWSFSTAALMAIDPSRGAVRVLSDPAKASIGVRIPERITASCMAVDLREMCLQVTWQPSFLGPSRLRLLIRRPFPVFSRFGEARAG